MKLFYMLTEPNYVSDHQSGRENGVRTVRTLSMPGIECSVCGSIWGGMEINLLPGKVPEIERLKDVWPLPDTEWHLLKSRLLSEMKLPQDTKITPGDCLTLPEYRVIRPLSNDVIHAPISPMLVNSRICTALEQSGLTGFSLHKVHLYPGKSLKIAQVQIPDYYLLLVTGKASQKRNTNEAPNVCEACGRSSDSDPQTMQVDLTTWDGSDIFHPDENPFINLVTPRFVDFLTGLKTGNIKLIPYPQH